MAKTFTEKDVALTTRLFATLAPKIPPADISLDNTGRANDTIQAGPYALTWEHDDEEGVEVIAIEHYDEEYGDIADLGKEKTLEDALCAIVAAEAHIAAMDRLVELSAEFEANEVR